MNNVKHNMNTTNNIKKYNNEKLTKTIIILLLIVVLMTIVSPMIELVTVDASSTPNILKVQELYKSKNTFNKQKEDLNLKKEALTSLRQKVEQGICTREDMMFGTALTVEEAIEKYELEIEMLNKEIKEKDKEIDGIDDLVKVYNKLIASESSTLTGVITEYSKVKLNITSKTDKGDGNNFINPAPGSDLTSKYGNRIHPIFKKKMMHHGIDLSNELGTDIKAAERGVVIYSSYNSGSGNVMVLAHNNKHFTVYAHIKENGFVAKKGETVEKGQVIAQMGNTGWSTGSHLHFEVFKGTNRQDPLKFIDIK